MAVIVSVMLVEDPLILCSGDEYFCWERLVLICCPPTSVLQYVRSLEDSPEFLVSREEYVWMSPR